MYIYRCFKKIIDTVYIDIHIIYIYRCFKKIIDTVGCKPYFPEMSLMRLGGVATKYPWSLPWLTSWCNEPGTHCCRDRNHHQDIK